MIERTNMLFDVKFNHTAGHFICHFVGYNGNTTCRVTVYKSKDMRVMRHLMNHDNKHQVENNSDYNLVTVTISTETLQDLEASELMLYFIALGITANFTIAVEDSIRIIAGG